MDTWHVWSSRTVGSRFNVYARLDGEDAPQEEFLVAENVSETEAAWEVRMFQPPRSQQELEAMRDAST